MAGGAEKERLIDRKSRGDDKRKKREAQFISMKGQRRQWQKITKREEYYKMEKIEQGVKREKKV